METVERWILDSFFPALFGFAKLLGLIGMVYVLSSVLSLQTEVPIPAFFLGILLTGEILFHTLRYRAVTRRIKKLLDGEAANIALAGSHNNGIDRDALGIIERRVYKKLCSEGLAKDGEGETSSRTAKKISEAILAKYNHLKGI